MTNREAAHLGPLSAVVLGSLQPDGLCLTGASPSPLAANNCKQLSTLLASYCIEYGHWIDKVNKLVISR